jgi:hypothetical protein
MGRACNTYRERRDAYRISVSKPNGRNNLQNPGIDGKLILKRIFDKWDGGMD